jgi:GT2 family glycosyltransferase
MIRLGGFIITHNRPKILLETIKFLFEQTQPPELLWIIDNSVNLETDHAIASLLDPRLKYYRMGFNAGPAGAAKQGLKLCGESGLDWIYWGNDVDLPENTEIFERLLSIKDENPYCRIIGTAGNFFDHRKGEIKRIQTRLLERKSSVEVEVISGGLSMLVHRDVLGAGIFPDPDLFFGFEVLDFCLKANRKGFAMLVHCKLFLELRARHIPTDFEWSLNEKKTNLVREYYSLRNLLYISDTLTLDAMKKRLIWKWIGKSVYGFRYGPIYGFKNFRMIWLAFYHYRLGVKGKTLDL